MDPFQADYQARHPGYLDGSVRSFLEELAQPSPEPAGGAALALASAAAASLVSLVCGTALARACSPAEREPLTAGRAEAAQIAARAARLIDDDVAAYGAVMRALALPAESEDDRLSRRAALDEALDRATDVPLQVAESALEALELASGLALSDRSPLRGDLAAARALAEAAVRGSVATARVNVTAVAEQAVAGRLDERVGRAVERLRAVTDSSASQAPGAPDRAE